MRNDGRSAEDKNKAKREEMFQQQPWLKYLFYNDLEMYSQCIRFLNDFWDTSAEQKEEELSAEGQKYHKALKEIADLYNDPLGCSIDGAAMGRIANNVLDEGGQQ